LEWIILSVFHSGLIYYLTTRGIGGDDGIWVSSFSAYSIALILVNTTLATQINWNLLNFTSIIGSILMWFIVGIIYCSIPSLKVYFVMWKVIQNPSFWFTMILVLIIGIFPIITFQCIQRMFFPMSHHIVQEIVQKTQQHTAYLDLETSIQSLS